MMYLTTFRLATAYTLIAETPRVRYRVRWSC